MNLLLVALGAALGAPARYLLDRFVQRQHSTGFPYGTLLVNLMACLLLGFVVEFVGQGAPVEVLLIAGTGFCATFSTYSTFSAETTTLLRGGAPLASLLNVTVSLTGGVLAALLGSVLAGLAAT